MLGNIFQPFDQRLMENKILPWWEILRATLHAGVAGLLTFTLTTVDYDKVVCMRNESSQDATGFKTSTEANFVNSICQTQLPWYCRHLVLWMSCIVILHILAEKWWLALPKVKSAISALGELAYINGSGDEIRNTTRLTLKAITTRENDIYRYRCGILIILDFFSLGFVFYIHSEVQTAFTNSLPKYNSLFYCNINNGAISNGDFLCVYNALEIVYLNIRALTLYPFISVIITLWCELWPYGGKFVWNFYENSEKKEVIKMQREIKESTTVYQDVTCRIMCDPSSSSDDNKTVRRKTTNSRRNKFR